MEIARFNKRVLSYLIDFLIPLVAGLALSSLLFFYTKIPWYFSLMLMCVICYGCYLLINVSVMYFAKGRTIGALIFGIKTTTKDNGVISLRNIWIKQLYLGIIPFAVANAIFMLVVHTELTLFDRITKTIVIDVRNSPAINDTLPEENEEKAEK